ncbi:MAG: LacI family transcriptional regulator [Oscillospiraceae bacterium]|nr:LacI family transcriptional regulator [Oscillospiraceae bacterium]
MVSIKDIASECGVSIATVSKALNNHKDVSEATKNAVRETAKRLGYLPNYQARALKTNRTYNLGVVFAERAQSGLTHSYFAAVLNSFKNEAEANGYDITFISSNIGNNPLTFYEHCISRNVDGVMVANVDDYEDVHVTELLESSVPLVTLDYKTENKPAVISDNYQGMQTLVKYVYDKGHRKIAYIYGDEASVTSIRIGSFRDALKSLNIEIREDYLLHGKYHDPAVTEQLAARLVKMSDPPTCIVLPDDFSAIGALTAFEKLGMSVPNDISIVGYDGIMLSQVLNPKLTTFKQDTEKLGAEAAKQLISLITKKISGNIEPIIVEGSLLEGSSVKNFNGDK